MASQSRKQARRQTYRQARKKRLGRLVLYHGTDVKSARSIRNSGLLPAKRIAHRKYNQTLATKVIRAKHVMRADNPAGFKVVQLGPHLRGYIPIVPRRGQREFRDSKGWLKQSRHMVKVSLTSNGVKKYLSDPMVFGAGDTNYAVSQRIPSRYIAKRRRGK